MCILMFANSETEERTCHCKADIQRVLVHPAFMRAPFHSKEAKSGRQTTSQAYSKPPAGQKKSEKLDPSQTR